MDTLKDSESTIDLQMEFINNYLRQSNNHENDKSRVQQIDRTIQTAINNNYLDSSFHIIYELFMLDSRIYLSFNKRLDYLNMLLVRQGTNRYKNYFTEKLFLTGNVSLCEIAVSKSGYEIHLRDIYVKRLEDIKEKLFEYNSNLDFGIFLIKKYTCEDLNMILANNVAFEYCVSSDNKFELYKKAVMLKGNYLLQSFQSRTIIDYINTKTFEEMKIIFENEK